jgi:hypothetical protein
MAATRSYSNSPTNSQLRPPTISKASAILFNVLIEIFSLWEIVALYTSIFP